MACGCPVIELDNEINRFHYGNMNPARLVPEDPDEIATAVIQLLDDEQALHDLAKRGKAFVKDFPTIQEAGERVDHLIRTLFR